MFCKLFLVCRASLILELIFFLIQINFQPNSLLLEKGMSQTGSKGRNEISLNYISLSDDYIMLMRIRAGVH